MHLMHGLTGIPLILPFVIGRFLPSFQGLRICAVQHTMEVGLTQEGMALKIPVIALSSNF